MRIRSVLKWPQERNTNEYCFKTGSLMEIRFVCFFFFFFFWPCLQYVEVSRPGMEPVPLQWQCWILNPLGYREILEIRFLIQSFFLSCILWFCDVFSTGESLAILLREVYLNFRSWPRPKLNPYEVWNKGLSVISVPPFLPFFPILEAQSSNALFTFS